ncbi:MAG: recombination protein RecO [Wolinella succinogenes]|uniref:recombination protein RecO n=1 Tax=Wolinella succinogenes TaxID=844 RepID=UPI0016A4F1D8|nr:recombination protein RecO [Wolinella succinogenes]NLU35272.1 recombination protein RecO [Wolinella succinogenes]
MERGLQGYVLDINVARDEDLWVGVLTSSKMARLYRFYGARHSVIQIGHKIDFEEEQGGAIPRLRRVMHLGFVWERDNHRRYWWQQYLRLLYRHLRDVGEMEGFYYALLDQVSRRLERQDAKRAILESHAALLEYEGRSHGLERCFLCEGELGDEVALARGFIGAHPECVYGRGIERARIEWFLREKNSTHLSDLEVEELWKILLQGI